MARMMAAATGINLTMRALILIMQTVIREYFVYFGMKQLNNRIQF